MKANEAPEKLYVDAKDNSDGFFLYGFIRKSGDEDIEYTRTDAFIEKAVEWLSRHFYDEEYQSMDNEGVWICADELINDFKNCMKG